MTSYLTASITSLAATLTLGTVAFADALPDLRGAWVGSYTMVQPSHYYKGDQPRFDQAEWVVDIQQQQDNVFWGPSKSRSQDAGDWQEYEITGAISLDGSGQIGLVETSPLVIGANALIDARYENGKIYADFRSLRNGTTYSTVLERQVN